MARPKKASVPKSNPVAAESAAEVLKKPAPLPEPAELERMIRTAAYFLAEKDNFRMDSGLYWKEAEREIFERFKGKGK